MSHSRNAHLIDFNQALITKESTPFASSDGVTSNRAIVYGPFDSVYNPRGWLAGAAVLEICGWVDVPSVNPTGNTPIYLSCSQSAPNVANLPSITNAFIIRFDSSGGFYIEGYGTLGSNDVRRFGITTFRATYSGQRIFLRVIITQGTANPVVWVNGINISSQFSASTAGTPPNWLDSNLNSTFHLVGFNWPSGNVPAIVPILGSMTEAEAANVLNTGAFPARIAIGGQTFSPPNFTFVGGFSVNNLTGSLASATGVTLTKTSGSSGSYEVANAAIMGVLGNNIFGLAGAEHRFRVEGSLSFTSGSGTLEIGMTGASRTVLGAGAFSVEIQGANSNSRLGIFAPVAGDTFTAVITNFKILPLGALHIPSVNPTQVISDATVIGNNSGLLIGGSTNCSCREGEFTNVISWNGTHEAKRIFGSAGRVHNGNIRILSIVTKATAASTGSGLTIGTTTSNNRYVTANTFTTAKKVHTLANVLPASTAVNNCDFVIDPDTANYTGAITVTVRYEMLSFTV
jgi:hypothetical protein